MDGTIPATADKLADLDIYLPLAAAAYLDQAPLEAEVEARGWHLLYHDTLTKAGERTSHFVVTNHLRGVITQCCSCGDCSDATLCRCRAAVSLCCAGVRCTLKTAGNWDQRCDYGSCHSLTVTAAGTSNMDDVVTDLIVNPVDMQCG